MTARPTLWNGLVRKGYRMFFDDLRLTAAVAAWILASCWLATSRLAVPVRAIAVFAGFAAILIVTTLQAVRRR